MNKYIEDIALLGTERRTLDIEQLPEVIQKRINSNENTEQQLIDALTYTAYYHNIGVDPIKASEQLNIATINEDKVYVSTEVIEILQLIQKQEYFVKNRLLKYWVKMVVDQDRILPPEHVISLIKSGEKQSKNTKQNIALIIGQRGRSILNHFYNVEAQKDLEYRIQHHWSEGTSVERIQLFKALRQQDHTRATELLTADWPTMGVREQRTFLTSMADTLTPEDLPFLESIYLSDYEKSKKRKKTELENKQLVSSMLCQLNYKPLYDPVKNELSKYVTEVKSSKLIGIILGKKGTELSIPKQIDDFWNGPNLSNLLGLDESNMDIKHFDHDPYYWLSQMIEILPFSTWTSLLDRSVKSTIDYFLNDPKFIVKISGKPVSILRRAILSNAVVFKNSELIEVIAKLLSGDDIHDIIPLMTQESFESYMINNKALDQYHLYNYRGDEVNNQWSKDFSKRVITALFNKCKNTNYYPNEVIGKIISTYYHHAAVPALMQISESTIGLPIYNTWNRWIEEPTRVSTNIKNRIRALRLSN